jgi:O-glycosyl hydrolase
MAIERYSVAIGILACVCAVGPRRALAVEVTIDRSTTYQTIEGFGFFGAMDDWWGTPSNLVNDAWATQVLNDLGITLWRNEYYPPADNLDRQDADWNKQKPVVQTLQRIADANHIPLRVLLTIWSPPSAMKCKVADGTWLPIEGTAPQSTKGGNTLCMNSRDAFVSWLTAGLQMYRDIGVNIYGLSFQNEPLFWQPYNSCFYQQGYYAQTLGYVGPKLKASFPQLKLFGAENMLEMEAGTDRDYFYTGAIKSSGQISVIDALAVHGYSDGVVPTPSTAMSTLWSTMCSYFAESMNKPLWMTETSGYVDTWTASTASDGKTYPGASDLAYAMYSALYYGHLSAWVWWQGSEVGGYGPYSLMTGTSAFSKRYYVSKQFFRFIRPGSRMVQASSSDSAVLAAAFENSAMGSLTAVLINASSSPKTVSILGTAVPTMFSQYTTTATDDCAYKGTVLSTQFTLPANSVNTFVYGNVFEGASTAPGDSDVVPALSWPFLALIGFLLLGLGWRRAQKRTGISRQAP